MSSHLRHDNECQNCGYAVDVAYCSKCGQNNTETRQPFHHLFTHFVEDLTHYDSNFWKTIKYLLFRPAKLTKEYLEGHRQRYVPPVKLYIFISFVTFFLLAVLPASKGDEKIFDREHSVRGYSSVAEYESAQSKLSEEKQDSWLVGNITKSSLIAKEKGYGEEYFKEAIVKTSPKMLFVYLPIFASMLWLFHGKKRWYFFDHGIFTLHYFSMLLLLYIIYSIVVSVAFLFSSSLASTVTEILSLLLALYSVFYFFMAHSKMYGERKLISLFKTVALLVVNIFFMMIVLVLGIIYIMINIH